MTHRYNEPVRGLLTQRFIAVSYHAGSSDHDHTYYNIVIHHITCIVTATAGDLGRNDCSL